MRSFVLLCLQIGCVAFLLSGMFATINYFTGWNLNFKGAEIPGDLGIGAVALVLGGASGLGARIMIKKKRQRRLNRTIKINEGLIS